MQNARKTVGAAAGVVAAACMACCVSLALVAPLLAWFGLSGLGFSTFGWSLPFAVLAMLAVPIFLAIHHSETLPYHWTLAQRCFQVFDWEMAGAATWAPTANAQTGSIARIRQFCNPASVLAAAVKPWQENGKRTLLLSEIVRALPLVHL